MAQQEVPWDTVTDQFISDIDKITIKEYDISFRDLLLNPQKYARPNFAATFKNIQNAVEAYFKDLLSGYADEQEKLNAELESLTSQYLQINTMISDKASLLKVPYIKPDAIDRNTAADEVITISKYDQNVDLLIGKLMSVSNFVADLSTNFGQSIFGSWLFSGQKNYVVSLAIPNSDVLTIEISKGTIDAMLANISRLF
ncbi:MAG: hypothetical protein ACP5T4_00880 [Candidatus Micrarchaeia archaeon]